MHGNTQFVRFKAAEGSTLAKSLKMKSKGDKIKISPDWLDPVKFRRIRSSITAPAMAFHLGTMLTAWTNTNSAVLNSSGVQELFSSPHFIIVYQYNLSRQCGKFQRTMNLTSLVSFTRISLDSHGIVKPSPLKSAILGGCQWLSSKWGRQ